MSSGSGEDSTPETARKEGGSDPARVALPPDPMSALLAQLGVRLEEWPAQGGSPSLSPAGLAEIRLQVSAYVADLLEESRRIAGRHRADTISPDYVRQASDRLMARPRRHLYFLVGTVGSICLGVALGGVIEIARSTQPSTAHALFTTLLTAVGMFCLGFQYMRE